MKTTGWESNKFALDGKDIFVLSMFDAIDFQSDQPWAAISIASTSCWPQLNEINRRGLLQLEFSDWKQPFLHLEDYLHIGDKIIFDEVAAISILNFVDQIWTEINVLVIHCQMGRSRSPAVAAAISKIKGGNINCFFESPRYAINNLVYSKILEVAENR